MAHWVLPPSWAQTWTYASSVRSIGTDRHGFPQMGVAWWSRYCALSPARIWWVSALREIPNIWTSACIEAGDTASYFRNTRVWKFWPDRCKGCKLGTISGLFSFLHHLGVEWVLCDGNLSWRKRSRWGLRPILPLTCLFIPQVWATKRIWVITGLILSAYGTLGSLL